MSPDDDKRRLFLVRAADEPDTLVRVLGVVTFLQARLRRIEAEPVGDGLSIRLEIEDAGEQKAEALARRLEACPSVRRLAFGWRGGLAPAAGTGH
jgi:acetolactate synthase regulatory subunit